MSLANTRDEALEWCRQRLAKAYGSRADAMVLVLYDTHKKQLRVGMVNDTDADPVQLLIAAVEMLDQVGITKKKSGATMVVSTVEMADRDEPAKEVPSR